MHDEDDITVKKVMDGLGKILRGDHESNWEDKIAQVRTERREDPQLERMRSKDEVNFFSEQNTKENVSGDSDTDREGRREHPLPETRRHLPEESLGAFSLAGRLHFDGI